MSKGELVQFDERPTRVLNETLIDPVPVKKGATINMMERRFHRRYNRANRIVEGLNRIPKLGPLSPAAKAADVLSEVWTAMQPVQDIDIPGFSRSDEDINCGPGGDLLFSGYGWVYKNQCPMVVETTAGNPPLTHEVVPNASTVYAWQEKYREYSFSRQETLLFAQPRSAWTRNAGFTGHPEIKAITLLRAFPLSQLGLKTLTSTATHTVAGYVVPQPYPQPQTLTRPEAVAFRPGHRPVKLAARGRNNGGPRTKERKMRAGGKTAQLLRAVVGTATESMDFIDALYSALPEERKSRWDRPDDKLRKVWLHNGEVNVRDASFNLVWAAAEDRVYAALGTRRANQRWNNSPVGWETGGALDGQGTLGEGWGDMVSSGGIGDRTKSVEANARAAWNRMWTARR